MGTLVKRHLAAQWGLQPGQVYHCAIMPCYDKKLEASREDFNVPGQHPCLTLTLCPSQGDQFTSPWECIFWSQ